MAGLDDYTGSFNDKLDQYLASLGLTGTLNDKLDQFTGYEGNVGQKLQAFYLGLVSFAPPAPENLVTSDITASAITLTWDEVAEADHYETYLDGSLVDDAVVTTSYEYTGLDADTTYILGVKTVDADDLKSTLSTISETTEPDETDPKTWAGYASGGVIPKTWADMETGGDYEQTWADLIT
jgi:hypothetical protein